MSGYDNVVKIPTGGSGNRGSGARDPLRLISPTKAAPRMDIPYFRVLELFKVYGIQLGGRYYMQEQRLADLIQQLHQTGSR